MESIAGGVGGAEQPPHPPPEQVRDGTGEQAVEDGGRGQDQEGDATELILFEEGAFPGHLEDPFLVVAVLGGLDHVDVRVRGQGDQKQVWETSGTESHT